MICPNKLYNRESDLVCPEFSWFQTEISVFWEYHPSHRSLKYMLSEIHKIQNKTKNKTMNMTHKISNLS